MKNFNLPTKVFFLAQSSTGLPHNFYEQAELHFSSVELFTSSLLLNIVYFPYLFIRVTNWTWYDKHQLFFDSFPFLVTDIPTYCSNIIWKFMFSWNPGAEVVNYKLASSSREKTTLPPMAEWEMRLVILTSSSKLVSLASPDAEFHYTYSTF